MSQNKIGCANFLKKYNIYNYENIPTTLYIYILLKADISKESNEQYFHIILRFFNKL